VTSINEPATAVKVDGRRYLNKRPPPTPGNYWWWVRPAASVERIRLPWNVSVTLIRPYSPPGARTTVVIVPPVALSLLVTPLARPIMYGQRAVVE